jgi:hypothetical protein
MWTCTTVQRAHGRLLSSVRGVLILQRHLSGTWPSLRAVSPHVIFDKLQLCVVSWRVFVVVVVRVRCVFETFRHYFARVCAAAVYRLIMLTAAGTISSVVDLYNSVSGTWSIAQLSVGRMRFAATSVGNVAVFAGGQTQDGNCSFAMCSGRAVFKLICVYDACLSRLAWCLRCSRLPSDEVHCRYSCFRCCGLLQQSIGHMVDCSAQWGALISWSGICWERGHLRGRIRCNR